MSDGRLRDKDLVLQLNGFQVSLLGSDQHGRPRFQVGITPCVLSCGDPACQADHPLVVGGQILTLAMPAASARELVGALADAIKAVESAEESDISAAALRVSLEGAQS